MENSPRQPQGKRGRRGQARTGEVHGLSHQMSPREGQLPAGPVSSRNTGVGVLEGSHGKVAGFAVCGGSPRRARCCATGGREGVTKTHTTSCRRPGWTSMTYNHIRHQVVLRTPRQCCILIGIEDTTPFRQSQGERNSGSLRIEG